MRCRSGVLTSELVMNAVKHAFAPGETGEVSVVLGRGADWVPVLEVADDGVGWHDKHSQETGGLGAKIIDMVARQFGGRPERSARFHEGAGAARASAGYAHPRQPHQAAGHARRLKSSAPTAFTDAAARRRCAIRACCCSLLRRAPHREGGDGTGEQGTTKGPMSGMTVLVVEDDFIVAYDMQMLLEEQGARVLGPAASLAEAQELLAQDRPTVAVLDVNLGGEYVFPLADELLAQDVPFVFATAYADDDRLFPEQARTAPRLSKPVLPNVLIGQLLRIKR